MVPEPPDDLLVRLINHRVSDDHARREDYATECLAWLLRHDHELLAELVRPGGLLFSGGSGYTGDLAALEVATQHTGQPFDQRSRPDLVIHKTDFMLVVEAKVDAAFSAEQVARYSRRAAKLPNAWVAALVPSTSAPAAPPSHERFLAVLTWERVIELLDTLVERARGPVQHRQWMLRLLDSYGLRPAAGPLDWHGEDGTQRPAVRTMCRLFDAVAAELAADPALAEALSPTHLPAGEPVVATKTLIAGKGAAPRPVLSHSVLIKSVYGTRPDFQFGDLMFTVEFRRRAGAASASQPSVWLEFRTHWYLGGEYIRRLEDFIAQVLVTRGVVDLAPGGREAIEQGAVALWQRFLGGVDGVLRAAGSDLVDGDSVPLAPDEVPRDTGEAIKLRLAPTTVLCRSGEDAAVVRQRYHSWLAAGIHALARAQPEGPLHRLIGEATLGIS